MDLSTLNIKIKVDAGGVESDLNSVADGVSGVGDGAGNSSTKVASLADVIKGNLLASTITKGVEWLASEFKQFASDVVSTGSDFDSAMSQVAATMGTTTNELSVLRDAAKEYGATTSFTATEAAEGFNILAMAGLDVEDQLAAISPVLDMAAAGSLSLESAASYTVGAVKGFGDEMENASYYADLMAKGATLANTNVEQLGQALSDSAATANSYNQSADSVTLSLLRLAESNVTGSEASTALNRAMADLYTPTDAAKSVLDDLGVSAYDAEGNARDFNDVVGDLSDALSGMSDEEANALKATVFTTQGLNAFNKMSAVSDDRLDELESGLVDVAGAAGDQAATQLDNLAGDITILNSAMDGMKVSLYEGVAGGLREAAQAATELIGNIDGEGFGKKIGEIISWFLDNGDTVITVISGVSAAFVGWNVATMISGVVTAMEGMSAAEVIVAAKTAIMNAVMNANPFVLVATLIAALVAVFITAYKTNDEFRAKVDTAWAAIKTTVTNVVNKLVTFFTSTIPNAVNNTITFFKELPNKALTWGKDLIQNFINGILEKWNNLKQTVSNVAQTVKNFLGFSEPKEGPLSNFHTYAPDMMELFSQGIQDNASLLEDTFNKSLDFEPKYTAVEAASGTAATAGTVTINLTVNGAKYSDEESLAEAISQRIQAAVTRRTAVWA